MVKPGYILTAAAFLLLILGIWLFFSFRTEEYRIRKRLHAFTEEVSKKNGEGGLQAMVIAGSLGNYFSDPTAISIDGLSWLNGSCSPEMITSNALRARRMFRSLTLQFQNPDMVIEGKQAEISLSAVLTGQLNSGDSVREIRELDIIMIKPEKKWLFQSLKIRNIIRK